MMAALRYAVEEALASLRRGGASSILSTATIAVALLVLGGFLLVAVNLDRVAAEWSKTAELSVYLDDAVTPEERQVIERQLVPGQVVAGWTFVSKEEAAVRFRETFADLAGTIETLDGNPLPASYEVMLQPAGPAPAVEALAVALRALPGVADVRFDREWLTRLVTVGAVVRGVGLALALVLTAAAALTVASVVRLALHDRRDEIDIMRLVGAPQAYIRGPFIAEGVLQGGIGAALALAVLAGGFLALRGRYLVPLAETTGLPAFGFLPAGLCLLLVVGGMAVGCLGGIVAARGTVTES
jgi:cell division transport system permease protein